LHLQEAHRNTWHVGTAHTGCAVLQLERLLQEEPQPILTQVLSSPLAAQL